MRLTLRLTMLWLMPLVLSMAAFSGCCRNAKPPTPGVVTVRQPCITKELQVALPQPSDPMTCSHQGHSVLDCLAHDVNLRDAWITKALANCGVRP